jgi:cytoskeletal protein CcmA (bactofilin family)
MVRLRKSRLIGLILLLATFSYLLVFAGANLAHAQIFQNSVDHGKTVDSSVYASGKTVTIDGTVNGDVYCVAQVVKIVGTVHGDVLCVGQTISITGTVDGSIRLAGQTVTVTGHVGRSASIAAADVQLLKGSVIGSDVTLVGTTASVDGTVGRDLLVKSSITTMGGTANRNVRSEGGQLSLTSGGHVKGSFTYSSNTAADVSQGRIDGTTTHMPQQKTHSIVRGFEPVWLLYVLVAGLLFSLVLVLILPQTINRVAGYPVRKLGKTILAGFLGSFALPLISLLLFVSVIGIPLGIFVLLAEITLALLSGPIAAYYIGSMIIARSHNAIYIMLVGALVVILLYFIPVAGILAVVLAYYIGLGSILLWLKDTYNKPDYRIE